MGEAPWEAKAIAVISCILDPEVRVRHFSHFSILHLDNINWERGNTRLILNFWTIGS